LGKNSVQIYGNVSQNDSRETVAKHGPDEKKYSRNVKGPVDKPSG
jgi:hypothetical protein